MQPQELWREIPQRYRLEASRCAKCGAVFFPPRHRCADCGNEKFEMTQLPREGKIVTFSVIRQAGADMIRMSPYAVCMIELEGGVRLEAQLVDVEPEAIKTGMRVRLEFRKIRESGEAGVICYGYKAVPA
ncbi:MAG: Zn-ribbon domain-containing OB-fold protein [Elusimicrobia bacterium]|nr:Zn-ribbon domain-containing OB-fold protein [Elusimicrobiota bacterium]